MRIHFPALALVFLVPACYPYGNEIVRCDVIPEGGCPMDRGGTCDDPACDAIYGCYEGVWKKTETCDAQGGQGGTGNATSTQSGGGSGGGGNGGGGGSECTPLMFDYSGEVVGCQPSLQSPDCPAAAAEPCQETACKTGCLDFFICKVSGWASVAYCTEEAGEFFPAPR